MSDLQRILVVRVGAMGDVLHALPAVAALRELRPRWEIGWAIEPRWSALLAAGSVASQPLPGQAGSGWGTQASLAEPRGVAMPVVDAWYGVETRKWKRLGVSRAALDNILGLRRELRQGRFDVAVDMQGLVRSALVGWMAGAGRLVGRAEPREGIARVLYEERIEVKTVHVVEQGCELLGAAVGLVLKPGRVALPVDAVAEAWGDGLGIGEVPFVFLAPTAGWGAKAWPAERYGQVAAELGKAGFEVLVNAVPGGDAVAEAVVKASGGAAVAVACSVGEMVALVRRAALVIAGDSGPLHLAAALERPVVGIYGPTDPARTGPYGVGTLYPGQVLRDASSVTSHARVAEMEPGMLRIEAEDVAGAAMEVLRGK
jgi:heptosyltransferase-1